MICTAIVPGIDSFNYFYTLVMTPMFLFSGIFFPVDTFPPVIVRIASFTPLFHLTNICRAFAWGNFSNVKWDIIWLIGMVIILVPLSFRLMRRRIIK
jgi:lipooligosaccharide transport system permease protein